MADQRIQYTELMVGANHPTLTDTLNHLALVGHNTDGTHKAALSFTTPVALMGSSVCTVSTYSVTATDYTIINNYATALLTVTIPAASLNTGRILLFKNLQAFTVVSAASDIAPFNSSTLGTAILPAIVGSWAMLQSNGTIWETIAVSYSPLTTTNTTTVTTSTYSATSLDFRIVNNYVTALMTLTLPDATLNTNREMFVQNNQAFTVISASANVLVSGSSVATTALLPAIIGSWILLKSNGVNWRTIAKSTNNVVTLTASTYSVLQSDSSLIANYAGTITLTLPAATTALGQTYIIKTIQAQTVVSVSSNVIPLAGGGAGTAILANTAGKWAMLQSDGTNWQIMMAN
jgi:hypothetical protein